MRRTRYRYTAKRKAAFRKAQLISARKRSRNKKIAITAGIGVLAIGAGAAVIYGKKDRKHGGGPREVIKHAPPAAKASAPEARDIVHENVRGFDQPKEPVSQSVSQTGAAPSASKKRSKSIIESPPKAQGAVGGRVTQSAAQRRVLVTGSRNLNDRAAVWDALDEQYRIHGAMTVVHGAHWEGADVFAAQWATSALADGLNIIHDPHPAEWKKYKRAAGPLRNKKMVDLGADIVLAFPRGKSSGTRNAMSLARTAGIKVVEL